MRTIDNLPLPQRDSYLSGYDAFMAGWPIESNPSDPESYFGTLWDWGWADAETDARQD
jgi:hypothetical protein